MERKNSVLITSASPGLSEDQSKRARKYLISMMIRTVCFILTVLLPSPYRWIALIFAVTLPYFAVVIANAGRESVLRPPLNSEDEKKAIEE